MKGESTYRHGDAPQDDAACQEPHPRHTVGEDPHGDGGQTSHNAKSRRQHANVGVGNREGVFDVGCKHPDGGSVGAVEGKNNGQRQRETSPVTGPGFRAASSSRR